MSGSHTSKEATKSFSLIRSRHFTQKKNVYWVWVRGVDPNPKPKTQNPKKMDTHTQNQTQIPKIFWVPKNFFFFFHSFFLIKNMIYTVFSQFIALFSDFILKRQQMILHEFKNKFNIQNKFILF
jgi:hypothetical protein